MKLETKRLLEYSSYFKNEMKNNKCTELGEEYKKQLFNESTEDIKVINAMLKNNVAKCESDKTYYSVIALTIFVGIIAAIATIYGTIASSEKIDAGILITGVGVMAVPVLVVITSLWGYCTRRELFYRFYSELTENEIQRRESLGESGNTLNTEQEKDIQINTDEQEGFITYQVKVRKR